MTGQTIKIKSREGGEFDCYLALPAAAKEPVPAIVLASAIHGVDEDLRGARRHFRRRTAISPPPPTCSGASCRARCRAPTSAPPSARSRASSASRPANPISPTRSSCCAG